MTRQFHFMLISLGMLTACGKQVKDDQSSTGAEVAAGQSEVPPSQADTTPRQNDSIKSEYPYQHEWIPGQRDSTNFDLLSRFRAHANRLSKEVLVLRLAIPATERQRNRAPSAYVVGDSAVVTGLLPNELFTDYCKIGSGSSSDGQIGGISNTGIWDEWQRPRLAWRFDTVTVRIRSIAADSVLCVLVRPDY